MRRFLVETRTIWYVNKQYFIECEDYPTKEQLDEFLTKYGCNRKNKHCSEIVHEVIEIKEFIKI